MDLLEKHNIYPKYQQYFIPKEKLEIIFNDMLQNIFGIEIKSMIWFDDETYLARLLIEEEQFDKMPKDELSRIEKNNYFGFYPDDDFDNFNKLSKMLFESEKLLGGFVCNFESEYTEFEVEYNLPFGLRSFL